MVFFYLFIVTEGISYYILSAFLKFWIGVIFALTPFYQVTFLTRLKVLSLRVITALLHTKLLSAINCIVSLSLIFIVAALLSRLLFNWPLTPFYTLLRFEFLK